MNYILGYKKDNKSNLPVFSVVYQRNYFTLLQKSAKMRALWKSFHGATILEITQDALCLIVAQVQPLHFNDSFLNIHQLKL